MTDRFATLTFERAVAAPVETLWQAWVTPGAPSPEVTVEYLSHATKVGERETSLCKVDGEPVVQVDAG
jgi:uncharacterized protein YndB with AHSA1/START domain